MTVDVRRFLLSVAAVSVGGSAVLIGQSSVDPPPDRPEPGERVLVVAFTNITGAPADAWIGEGIAETVSTDLERLQGLAVVGHRALPSLDDAAMIDAGRRLGAQWVLGGGYQHVAERLRLTAQLVHVDTARVVYTAKVDGVIGDLFELQDRLVAALTGGAPAPAPAVDATLPASSPQPAGGSGFAPAAMGFIDGPAPPAPPETITRDELGRATMRAVRIAEPLSLDGELDEPIYDRVPAVSGFIQQLPR